MLVLTLRNWYTQVKASDIDGLSKLSLEMQKCEITLSRLGFASDVDNSENLRRIVKRLPMHMRVKWVDIAHSINESGREPRFSDLAKFVDEKSRVASSVYGLDHARENIQVKSENKVSLNRHQSNGVHSKTTTLTTQSAGESPRNKRERKCRCCSGICFDLVSCNKFKSMRLDERVGLVRKLKLCYNCLKGKPFIHNL